MAQGRRFTEIAAAIISKPNKPELANIVPRSVDWFRARDYQLAVDPETAPAPRASGALPRPAMANRRFNFVVVLGGDGTCFPRRAPSPRPAFRSWA